MKNVLATAQSVKLTWLTANLHEIRSYVVRQEYPNRAPHLKYIQVLVWEFSVYFK